MTLAKEGPHAQFAEDRILEQIFANQTHGYCVEVGAYDGRTGSATYLFEKKGWNCLLIEPLPDFAEEIQRHRTCIVKNCAASSREGEATFFVAENVEQMSTLRLTPEHHQWINDVGGRVRQITVRTSRLDTLLAESGFPEIHFITIDVEGHEIEVLQGLSLATYRPRVVIIEENGDEAQSEVTRYLAGHSYLKFKRTGVNDWYAHESDGELIKPDALRQFERAQSRRRRLNRIKARAARWLPASVRRRLGGLLDRLSTRA